MGGKVTAVRFESAKRGFMRIIQGKEYYEPHDLRDEFGLTTPGLKNLFASYGKGRKFFGRTVFTKQEVEEMRKLANEQLNAK